MMWFAVESSAKMWKTSRNVKRIVPVLLKKDEVRVVKLYISRLSVRIDKSEKRVGSCLQVRKSVKSAHFSSVSFPFRAWMCVKNRRKTMDQHFFDIVENDDSNVDKASENSEEKAEMKDTAGKTVENTAAEVAEKAKAEDAGDGKRTADRGAGKTRRSVDASGAEKPEEADDEEPRSFFAELVDWLKVIVVAALLAFLLNNFIIANSTIPTGSMQDTIMAGARVFGSRLQYTFGDVKRGDIAIFVYGYKCKNDGQTYRETDAGVCPYCGRADKDNSVVYYVKRVIGMPGDHIEIKQTGTADASEFHNIEIENTSKQVPIGTVYVNGEAIAETYLPEPMIVDGNQFPEVDVTVPEGHYYMLGDNRNNSLDARYWGEYNMVARDKMVAKVYFKYWPLNDMGMVH